MGHSSSASSVAPGRAPRPEGQSTRMILLGTYPDWKIVLLPIILLQLILLVVGLGAIFAALGLASSDWDKL